MTPLQDLIRLSGLGELDEATALSFLAGSGNRVMVFSGIEKRRPEAQDVAVVVREFLTLHRGGFTVAVLGGSAEDRVKTKVGVVVLPSIVLINAAGETRVIARIQDWDIYVEAFATMFGQPPALAAE